MKTMLATTAFAVALAVSSAQAQPQGEVVPNAPVTALDARHLSQMVLMVESGLNKQRCLAGLANCLNNDQLRSAVEPFLDKLAKSWDVLTQKDRNCTLEVVLQPSLGSVQEACGIAGDKIEYAEVYVRALIDAIGP
jgi:hypothetical protein